MPTDVTNQYTRPSGDEEQYSILQTNESDMFVEYELSKGNNTFKLVYVKDSSGYVCKTCASDCCEHVKKTTTVQGNTPSKSIPVIVAPSPTQFFYKGPLLHLYVTGRIP
jgi:hypothetical protein